MRVELQPAFVIHRRPYRNTSWLLELFTYRYGLIALIAKGARRSNHRWRSLLEPFCKLQVSYSGRSDLMVLTGVEPSGLQTRMQGEKIFAGIYINELLQRLLHRHDPHEALFQAYEIALHELELANDGLEPVLRRFEIRLLSEIGYGLQLTHNIVSGKYYYYDIERGPVVSEKESHNTPVVSGDCLLALAENNFSNKSLFPEMKVLLRCVLHHHLAGKPVKSRELFTSVISNK